MQFNRRQKHNRRKCICDFFTNEASRKTATAWKGTDSIEALRVGGGVMNTAIVMAAANGIVSAKEVTLLPSRGGNIDVNKNWEKSLLHRMK